MGKLTISMAIFNSFLYVYQRVTMMIGLVTITVTSVTALCGFVLVSLGSAPGSEEETSTAWKQDCHLWAFGRERCSVGPKSVKSLLKLINYREIEREIDDKLSSQLSLHLHVFVLPVADASPRHEGLALKMESTPSWLITAHQLIIFPTKFGGPTEVAEKAREPETQENLQQQAAMAAVNAAINAARMGGSTSWAEIRPFSWRIDGENDQKTWIFEDVWWFLMLFVPIYGLLFMGRITKKQTDLNIFG